MALFGKKRVDVIDFTRLQKQGILKRVEESSAAESSGSDVVDLSSSSLSSTDSSGTSSNPLAGFFNNVDSPSTPASSAFSSESAVSNSENSYGSYTDKLKTARASKLAEFNSMKIKLEDAEYKLGKALERIEKLEEKFFELERR